MEKHDCSHLLITPPQKRINGEIEFVNLNETIMLRQLLMPICFSFIAMVTRAEDGQKIDSRLQKVVVFLNSAQVTRTATINITAGTSTLTFTNLSPGIDVQSIQVHANGEFTILSVKHELSFLNLQTKLKNLEDLQGQQKAIQDKITTQNNFLAVDQEEEAMLLKNQVISGANVNLDVIKLQQALDFQTARLTEIKKKKQIVN